MLLLTAFDATSCFGLHTSIFLSLQRRVPVDELAKPVLADRLGRARRVEDAVGEELDFLLFDGEPESFLRENPGGQVFFLLGAQLLHDLGFVLAFWLGAADDAVAESGKGDAEGLAGFADGLAVVDGLEGGLDGVFWCHCRGIGCGLVRWSWVGSIVL